MLQKVKKKKIVLFLLLAFLILGFLFSPCIVNYYERKSAVDIDINKKYSSESLLYDLDFLVKTAEDVHPNLYDRYSKSEFEEALKKAKSQIDKPLSRKEFFLIVAPLMAKFDGHTAIYTPEKELNTYINSDGKLFPFDVMLETDSLFITKDYSQSKEIPVGSEIIAINGVPSKEILQKLLSYESRETVDGRLAELSVRFRFRLWLVFGFDNEFEIEYKDIASNQLVKHKVNGISKKDIDKQSPKRPKYSYKEVDGKIGILEFNEFSNQDDLDKFLAQTFQNIKDHNIEKLVIDIRNNGGGNYLLGEKLINYISTKHYKLVSKQEIKASKQTKKYIKKMQAPCFLCNLPVENFDKITNKVWDTRDGELTTVIFDDVTPDAKNLKFKGKLYIATGPFTYSSAAVFANAASQYNLGILVGEETGGLGVFYSDPYKFRLPNTKLDVGISYRKFYLPDQSEKPIYPDVKIENKLESNIKGEDTVIEYIKNDR
jgi:hypothetical protein